MAKFIGVGVGPGDSELLTAKAIRIINESDVEEAKRFLNNFEYIKGSHLERVKNFLKTFEV